MRPQDPAKVADPHIISVSVNKVLLGNVSMGNPIGFDTSGQPSQFTQDNTDGVMIRVGANANPNSLPNFWVSGPTLITHNLGRVPIGYYITRKNKTCDVFDGTVASWSLTKISLQITDITADTTVYIF